MLYFLQHYPLAWTQIGRPGCKPSSSSTAPPGTQQSTQRKKKPISFGYAIGPLGTLFGNSCTPNVRRQLNLHKGTIEYVAIASIAQGEPLTIGWPSYRGRERKAWIMKRFLKQCQIDNCVKCTQPVSQAPAMPPPTAK